jgi:ribosome recycling factor
MTMLDTIYAEADAHMKRCIEHLQKDLSTLRTGKATPALLEGILVEAYGAKMPINQVATLGSPEPRLLTVTPFDASQIGAIEKALLSSDLGITPNNDGHIIRLPIPPLNEERRKEFAKMARNKGEDAKVAIRSGRREANEALKRAQGASEITEDDLHRGQDRVQKLTDEFTKQVDKILEAKEKDILEV